jgi:hypothetical protein
MYPLGGVGHQDHPQPRRNPTGWRGLGVPLGTDWSKATPEREAAITVRHVLTMASGLNDSLVYINASMKRGGQARDIIVDARGLGLSQPEAVRALARIQGIARGRLDRIPSRFSLGSPLNGMKSSSCPPREATSVCDSFLLTRLCSQ